MDLIRIGKYIAGKRKKLGMTQRQLAEKLGMSDKSVSKWERGSNMPDISLLVELSEFYQVSISEIIDGERKSEKMNQDVKDTAVKMAEYSKNELSTQKKKTTSALCMIFGAFIIISALAIFPNESSWGSIYSILGGIILTVGVYFMIKVVQVNRSRRVLSVAVCVIVLAGIFTASDYVAVSQFHQVPRFSYEKSYGENVVEHKTLFYTVIQKNPGSADEIIELQ